MSSIDDELDDDSQDREAGTKVKEPARWYAVQVASGCENRVKIDLTQRIHSFSMGERIYQIEIPQTPTIRLKKDGTKTPAEEKVFPGYVLVSMSKLITLGVFLTTCHASSSIDMLTNT